MTATLFCDLYNPRTPDKDLVYSCSFSDPPSVRLGPSSDHDLDLTSIRISIILL